jgi:hypothetical protein
MWRNTQTPHTEKVLQLNNAFVDGQRGECVLYGVYEQGWLVWLAMAGSGRVPVCVRECV